MLAYLIPQPKLLLAQLHAPAQALRNAEPFVVQLASELEADAPETRVVLCVDLDARCYLAHDRAEVAGFETARGGQRACVGG